LLVAQERLVLQTLFVLVVVAGEQLPQVEMHQVAHVEQVGLELLHILFGVRQHQLVKM
jgi:hypothetical protein